LIKRTLALGSAALVAAASFHAAAQDIVRPGQDTWTIKLGLFLPAFDTDLRVDSDRGRGDNVNLADDLGVEQNEAGGWFGVEWRFVPRHRLAFQYSRFTLSGERTIQRDLEIGDAIFPVGASVSSQLRLEIIPLTYSYSILKREDDELALTVGLHWSRIRFNAAGSASNGPARDTSSKADVPLPLLGLRYDRNFGPRWSVGALAGVFALEFGEDAWSLQGSLWNARLHAEYRFARNFAIGAALDGFSVKVDVNQDRWNGSFDYRYWGPQIFLTARY
jgi:hypothetical protein